MMLALSDVLISYLSALQDGACIPLSSTGRHLEQDVHWVESRHLSDQVPTPEENEEGEIYGKHDAIFTLTASGDADSCYDDHMVQSQSVFTKIFLFISLWFMNLDKCYYKYVLYYMDQCLFVFSNDSKLQLAALFAFWNYSQCVISYTRSQS